MGVSVPQREDQTLQLPLPWLFQAPEQTLDLLAINPGDPVVVSVFLPNPTKGESYSVTFGGVSKPCQVDDTKLAIYDVTFALDELPPVGQFYEVYYSFRGVSSPKLQIELVDGLRYFVIPRLHLCSLAGTYAAGLLDAWVVPAAYRLTQDTPVVHSRDTVAPAPGVAIEIQRQMGGQMVRIGAIGYVVGTGWVASIDAPVELATGDLLALTLKSPQPSPVTFSISL
jgi:hypothetical protein